MPSWVQLMVAVFTAVLASTGFWTYVQRKDTTRTMTNKLLLGLAYDKIVDMGMRYIERGWITKDEYEDYRKYLYEPYKALGGNGVTERIVAEVANLPIKSRYMYAQLIQQVKESRPEFPDSAAAEVNP